MVLYTTGYLPWLSHFYVTLKKQHLSTNLRCKMKHKNATFELISSNINSCFLCNKIDSFSTPCKEIWNILGLWIRHREFRLDSWFFVNGTEILDSNRYSFSCAGRIPKQNFPHSGFHKHIFPDSGIRIPSHEVTFEKECGSKTNQGVEGCITLSMTPRTANPSSWGSDVLRS